MTPAKQPIPPETACLDGNEAAARVAFRLNELCVLYPITPSSPMGEWMDQWAAEGQRNLWDLVPKVVEMQSEAGAAGTLHGALLSGAAATTFTSSQGLLLMLPNLYKIAGELLPCVVHVAARAIATHALSIFGDHSDVMAARQTGCALLASASVQEAHDFALASQAAAYAARLPFLHFFDGFRTSHELNHLSLLSDDDLRALFPETLLHAHRARGMDPEHPVIRGTAQNPDVFFQGREAANGMYARLPALLRGVFTELKARTGRGYGLVDWHGPADAERVIVAMGSGAITVLETVAALAARGEKVGLLQIRLYRPWPAEDVLAALPASVRAVAVLDRCKEPGSFGEPLFLDVLSTLAEHRAGQGIRVIGGRYGLSSKDFTPAMAKAVFDELAAASPRPRFTVGIDDDLGGLSLSVDPAFDIEAPHTTRAIFYGLGADGTVGANKNSIRILGRLPGLYAQGYFVYDSKKSGSRTVSHLRFGPEPIHAPWLISSAGFVSCHQFEFTRQVDLLERAAPGVIFLLNSPHGPESVWDRLPPRVQADLLRLDARFFVIDAHKVARESGLGGWINTVMQTCFFALGGMLPRGDALAAIREAARESYAYKGEAVVAKNLAAIDLALDHLHEVSLAGKRAAGNEDLPTNGPLLSAFVRDVTLPLLADRGDRLPTSRMPIDGTWPLGTARLDKRDLSATVPKWEPELCTQCGNCVFVCPHAVIRAKQFDAALLADAPAGFQSAPLRGRGDAELAYSLHIDLDQCTGCRLCVDICPAKSKSQANFKALNVAEKALLLEGADARRDFFAALPFCEEQAPTVRGVQFLEPLFEFPGACAGCGETPYIRLLSQLFGERMLVANATGCSSIYGGNLPTTPWTANAAGHGPAWANSLFEDNAEFGLGMCLAADLHRQQAEECLRRLGDTALVDSLLAAKQESPADIAAQWARVDALRAALASRREEPEAARLLALSGHLVRRSVWIIGGDGWAYDIGSGGLEHVLASGHRVKVLVLDTEVYSNTGGQASKATPMGAVAKFATDGKTVGKSDKALAAMLGGNCYVARVALGANLPQTLRAFREAEAFDGPALILAYSPCIAHGYSLSLALKHQALAVRSGYWPLLRYNPALRAEGKNPLILDSPPPEVPLRDYYETEMRFKLLQHAHPERAAELLARAQDDLRERERFYRKWAEAPATETPA